MSNEQEAYLCCGNCMRAAGSEEALCCSVFLLPTDLEFLCGCWLGPEGQDLAFYPPEEWAWLLDQEVFQLNQPPPRAGAYFSKSFGVVPLKPARGGGKPNKE